MRVFILALKDLQQITRDRRSALFVVVMPVLFTFFLIFMAGGNGSNGDSRLPVSYVNLDQGGIAGAELRKLLDSSEVVRVVVPEDKDRAKVGDLVRDGKFAAAITLPAGYTEQLLAGNAVSPPVIADQGSQTGQSAANAIQSAFSRLMGAVQVARQTTQAAEPFASATARQNYFNEALLTATKAWSKPALSVKVEQSGAQVSPNQLSAATQLSPGILVQFVMLGLISSAMIVMLERKTFTISRMLTTSFSRTGIMAGHVLAMFAVIFFQEVLLVAFGQIVFGVNYLREPFATLLVMLALALWTASLGLLIGVVAKVQEQVVMFSLICMFTFATLGGCWFSLEYTGPVFSTIGHLTPTAWAMEGFQNIVVRGQGLGAVLMPVAILAAYAAAFFGAAAWRFKAE